MMIMKINRKYVKNVQVEHALYAKGTEPINFIGHNALKIVVLASIAIVQQFVLLVILDLFMKITPKPV